jgi:hypothetical protein
MSMQAQNELDSLAQTMPGLNIEIGGGLASGIVALKEALLKADAEKEGTRLEPAAALEQQAVLRDMLKSLAARDEEIAAAKKELRVLRATVRTTVTTSRQSIVKDLNHSSTHQNGEGHWVSRAYSLEDRPRGHISSIDVDMVYGNSPSLSASQLENFGGDLQGETQVRDGDNHESYGDVADAYQRAAAYRKHLRAREQSLLGRSVSGNTGTLHMSRHIYARTHACMNTLSRVYHIPMYQSPLIEEHIWCRSQPGNTL